MSYQDGVVAAEWYVDSRCGNGWDGVKGKCQRSKRERPPSKKKGRAGLALGIGLGVGGLALAGLGVAGVANGSRKRILEEKGGKQSEEYVAQKTVDNEAIPSLNKYIDSLKKVSSVKKETTEEKKASLNLAVAQRETRDKYLEEALRYEAENLKDKEKGSFHMHGDPLDQFNNPMWMERNIALAKMVDPNEDGISRSFEKYREDVMDFYAKSYPAKREDVTSLRSYFQAMKNPSTWLSGQEKKNGGGGIESMEPTSRFEEMEKYFINSISKKEQKDPRDVSAEIARTIIETSKGESTKIRRVILNDLKASRHIAEGKDWDRFGGDLSPRRLVGNALSYIQHGARTGI